MNDQFDELAKGLAQSVTRRGALKKFGFGLAGIALASLFAGQAHATDLYADAGGTVNGDGTAPRPYWRITDAVARARQLRQAAAIPLSERIVIHVAPGTYVGSKEDPVLDHSPRYEARFYCTTDSIGAQDKILRQRRTGRSAERGSVTRSPLERSDALRLTEPRSESEAGPRFHAPPRRVSGRLDTSLLERP